MTLTPAEELTRAEADGGGNPLVSTAGRMPPERLRLLRSLFARICQGLRDRLFGVSGVLFETALEDVSLRRVEEAGLAKAGWLIALCPVERQTALSCIGMDAGAVNLVIEAFLGGGASGRGAVEERKWTAFDRLLAGQAAEVFIAAMEDVLTPSVGLAMKMDEIRPADEIEELLLEERPVLEVRVGLQALGESGQVVIILPSGLFSALNACSAEDSGEGAGPADASPWTEELDSRLRASQVPCRAVLDGGEMPLADIARLRPGQVLELGTRGVAPVRLECDGETLFHCDIGQAGGVFTLKLRKPANREAEFLESVMGQEKEKHND